VSEKESPRRPPAFPRRFLGGSSRRFLGVSFGSSGSFAAPSAIAGAGFGGSRGGRGGRGFYFGVGFY